MSLIYFSFELSQILAFLAAYLLHDARANPALAEAERLRRLLGHILLGKLDGMVGLMPANNLPSTSVSVYQIRGIVDIIFDIPFCSLAFHFLVGFLGSKNNVGPCPNTKENKNITSSHS